MKEGRGQGRGGRKEGGEVEREGEREGGVVRRSSRGVVGGSGMGEEDEELAERATQSGDTPYWRHCV